MTDKEVFLTPGGLKKLKKELEYLYTQRRHEVADQLHQAIESGSAANNAEYDDAKNEQAFVEGRILTIETMIKNAKIIDSKDKSHDTVKLGSNVTVCNQNGEEENYLIVGSVEASPGNGRISNESPIGQALIGKHVGAKIHVKAPAGDIAFTITKIN